MGPGEAMAESDQPGELPAPPEHPLSPTQPVKAAVAARNPSEEQLPALPVPHRAGVVAALVAPRRAAALRLLAEALVGAVQLRGEQQVQPGLD